MLYVNKQTAAVSSVRAVTAHPRTATLRSLPSPMPLWQRILARTCRAPENHFLQTYNILMFQMTQAFIFVFFPSFPFLSIIWPPERMGQTECFHRKNPSQHQYETNEMIPLQNLPSFSFPCPGGTRVQRDAEMS